MSAGRLLAAFVGLAAVGFGLPVLLTHQPFVGDDWAWLVKTTNNPSFAATDSSVFSRMPVFNLWFVWALKAGVIDQFPRLLLVVCFALYAAAFGILFQLLLGERSGPAAPVKVRAFLVAGLVFLFTPNNYEIHLWHIEALHALGALCTALSFRFRGVFARILFAALAFLTYETFVLLFAGYFALQILVRWGTETSGEKWPDTKRTAAVFLGALGLSCAVKYALARVLGQSGFAVAESHAPMILSNLKSVWNTMWLVHYYRADWVLSIMVWVGAGTIACFARRAGGLATRKVWLLVLLPLLSAAPLALNTYTAQRAYFGPQMTQALVLAYLAYFCLEAWPFRSRQMGAALALIVAAYSIQWGRTLIIKDQNYQALREVEALTEPLLAECQSPCRLSLPSPRAGLRGGGSVLPDELVFYERLARRFPHKQFHFSIQR